ncbi:hypothetical protein [Streptomyces flaveolus]|uniref:hypothetical protein n=1 Tax=Streptomyces flaveolus TaxID=67297 RepID=UPI0036F7AA5B
MPGEVARGGLVGDRARVHAVALAAGLEGGPVRAGFRLLKVVNSQPYGPDVVELVEDVTRAATSPLPAPAPTTSRNPHRA